MNIDELSARGEIANLLACYASGADRGDWALVRACYHADAPDDHGLYQGGVDGLMAFLHSKPRPASCRPRTTWASR